MAPEELTKLASEVRVRYFEVGETVFEEGESARDWFFVVKKGCIALRRRAVGDDLLVDLTDQGDMFGIRALLGTGRYSATARAQEDSLVYEIPWTPFRGLMDRCPPVALYLAAGFAAELPQIRDELMKATRDAHRSWSVTGITEDADQLVEPTRDVLVCGASSTVREAAQRMHARSVGSIVVADEARRPIGLLTDTDLRGIVAKGIDAGATRIDQVMSRPVRTVAEPQTVAALMELVMQTGLHHFIFTEDGSAESALTGIASEHDLITSHGLHPTVLRQRMARTRDPEELRKVRVRVETMLAQALEHGAKVGFLASLMAGIGDALVRSAIRIAEAELEHAGRPAPGVPYAFLAFGSEGRMEQLLRTDLDQAIVYGDPPPGQEARVSEYYLALGTRVTDILVQVGFERCRGGVMASNPELTRPMSAWKASFDKWIRTPEPKALMLANIFFDLRPLEGDRALADQLVEHIRAAIRAERAFLPFLAHSALQNPAPLSFFRGFVVEKSGSHADGFDLKARAMMPLADAARVLTYDLELDPRGVSTSARFRRVGAAAPELARLADEGAMAYEILMRVRTQEGLRTGTSGRYIDISRLNKLERRTLRNTFAVIEDMQRMLSMRYSLAFMR
jgi:CBS domain-containing protein